VKRMNVRTSKSRAVSIGLITCVIILGGCAGQSERRDNAMGRAVVATPIADAHADQVFDAARETLMGFRFALDRVDARRGVITTHPKRTAGIATPWDKEQSGIDQEWEDLLNEQRRVVRIEFDPAGEQAADQERTMRIQVEVVRTHRPNWRIETESVRLSNHAQSRDADGVLEPGSFTEVVGLDERFAQRIADAIETRLSSEADER
jgi:hypothetical protein